MKICPTKDYPKLCHARPGDVVQLFADNGELEPDLFIVAFNGPRGSKACNQADTAGLYSDERRIFLVNAETGEAIRMPHLSGRVEIYRDACLNLGTEAVKRHDKANRGHL